MKIKVLIAFLGLSISQGLVFADNATVASTANNIQSLPDFSGIYDTVGKSVVNITVTKIVGQSAQGIGSTGDPLFDYFFKRMVPPGQQRKYKQNALDSGFIISKDGYILTNAHVVKDADTVNVKLNDKREFKAKVIGFDTGTDVALLKIDATNLQIVKIGNPNSMKPGNWVVAIGSPFGLENTITQGTISAMSRNLPDDTYIPFIQTDVPINPGNSGGPLINLNGEVIGINSQIYSQSGGYMGIAFAIPIDYAITVSDQLKKTGKVTRGKLGIAVQPLTDDLAKSFGLQSNKGALVNTVEPDSPAAKAGVQVGDIILKANGQEVSDSILLPRLVGQLGPNKKVVLTVWRNGKTIDLNATTVVLNSETSLSTSINSDEQVKSVDKLGLKVKPLTDVNSLPKGFTYGLIIQDASQDIQMIGIVPGDLIVGIGSHNVRNFTDFSSILAKYAIGSRVPLKILRGDSRQYVTLFAPLPVVK